MIVRIVDQCPDCLEEAVDLSQELFAQVAQLFTGAEIMD